jgi:RsmE family RNA methyltransferase
MNIILVQEEEIQGNCVKLIDHRAEHIVKVLRAEAGERVKLGCINGPLGYATIVSIKKKFPFEAELEICLVEPMRAKPHLDLILALPRPIMLKRILSQVTALGVGTIHLVNAKRVEKSFWEASILDPLEYNLHLLQGLEQAVDTRVPDVQIHTKFKPFVEDFLPQVIGEYGSLICAHPLGNRRLMEVISQGVDRVLLAIGPEGGWIDYEVNKFQEQQFACCSIGNRILKVDTAVVALHSQITALREKNSEIS